MKKKLFAISVLAAALVVPAFAADDNTKDKAQDKVADANRKTHEKICEGHHGTVTAKSDSSITIDGKQYAYVLSTPTTKQGEALISKTAKVGDQVCFVTEKAADGTQQISKLIAIDKNEKVRVRERESDSTGKGAPGKDNPGNVDDTPKTK